MKAEGPGRDRGMNEGDTKSINRGEENHERIKICTGRGKEGGRETTSDARGKFRTTHQGDKNQQKGMESRSLVRLERLIEFPKDTYGHLSYERKTETES